MIRTGISIDITPLHNGAAVKFPKDATLIASLRARFPKAFWGPGTLSWHVPGKLAAKRLAQWASEQQDYLRRIEQAARDQEWDEAAPGRPAKWTAPPPNTSVAGRRVTWLSIAGQGGVDVRPPDGEAEKAIQAVTALDERMAHKELFGFLRRRYEARYDPFAWPEQDHLNYTRPGLVLVVDRSETLHARSNIHIHWRWRPVYGGVGWAEHGWHPDANYLSLHSPTMIWGAINPGKRCIL